MPYFVVGNMAASVLESIHVAMWDWRRKASIAQRSKLPCHLACLLIPLLHYLPSSNLVLLCLPSLTLSPLYFISCLSCVILDGEKISPTMQFIYDVLHHSSMKATRPWVHDSNLFSYFYRSQISPVKDLERCAYSTWVCSILSSHLCLIKVV